MYCDESMFQSPCLRTLDNLYLNLRFMWVIIYIYIFMQKFAEMAGFFQNSGQEFRLLTVIHKIYQEQMKQYCGIWKNKLYLIARSLEQEIQLGLHDLQYWLIKQVIPTRLKICNLQALVSITKKNLSFFYQKLSLRGYTKIRNNSIIASFFYFFYLR